MKKIFISFSIIMLLLSVMVTAEAVKQEDLKAVELLIDVMSSKIGDYSDRIQGTEKSLKGLSEMVDAYETKIKSLETADRFLWTKIEAKSDKDAVDESITTLNELAEELEQHRDTTNQRLKWIDMTITKNKNRFESVSVDLESMQKEFDARLDESIWSLNKRLKWVDAATGRMSVSFASLAKQIEANRTTADEKFSDLETAVDNNQAAVNQRMKWTDISLSSLKGDVKSNKDAIQELMNETKGLKKESTRSDGTAVIEMDETFASLNQRLKWMDISSSSTKRELEEIAKELAASDDEIKQELAAAVASLNQRLKWMDIASTSLRGKVEKQAVQIQTVEASLKQELADKIAGLNQRLKWMDISINKIKRDKTSEKDVLSLKQELDANVLRLNEIAFRMTFSEGVTNQLLEKLSVANEQISLLNTRFNIISPYYVTKKMLEEEIAHINMELDEVEELTYALNDESQLIIERAVWSINQRLKWIDITIKKAKDERTQLAQHTQELEERLENDINTKVLNINKRLKWMDISITNLKQTKVDEVEYTRTVARLETVKVDKDIFGEEMSTINKRFVSLEDELYQFKNETATLMKAQKEELVSKIDKNRTLINLNTGYIENNETEIETLKKRIEQLEAEVFPEPIQPDTMGILVGFGLVIGLGMILASAN